MYPPPDPKHHMEIKPFFQQHCLLLGSVPRPQSTKPSFEHDRWLSCDFLPESPGCFLIRTSSVFLLSNSVLSSVTSLPPVPSVSVSVTACSACPQTPNSHPSPFCPLCISFLSLPPKPSDLVQMYPLPNP